VLAVVLTDLVAIAVALVSGALFPTLRDANGLGQTPAAAPGAGRAAPGLR